MTLAQRLVIGFCILFSSMLVLDKSLSMLSEPSDFGVLSGIGTLCLLALIAPAVFIKFVVNPIKAMVRQRHAKTLIVAALLAWSAACTRVEPGHVGIVVNQWGSEKGVSDYVPTTGTFMYNPFTTTVYKYPVYMQNVVWTKAITEGNPLNEEITFTIKGNMAISVDVSLAYSLTQSQVPQFYVQFRSDSLETFTHGFLHNVTRDCFNELGGRYELDQIMGDNAEFVRSVREELQKRVGGYGVVIQQFGVIGAPRPPDAVSQAITAKIGATQLAIQKQNELVQAQADAQKVIARAEGDAKANERLGRSITPELLQWQAFEIQRLSIAKWNGVLPTYTGGPLPFLPISKSDQGTSTDGTGPGKRR